MDDRPPWSGEAARQIALRHETAWEGLRPEGHRFSPGETRSLKKLESERSVARTTGNLEAYDEAYRKLSKLILESYRRQLRHRSQDERLL